MRLWMLLVGRGIDDGECWKQRKFVQGSRLDALQQAARHGQHDVLQALRSAPSVRALYSIDHTKRLTPRLLLNSASVQWNCVGAAAGCSDVDYTELVPKIRVLSVDFYTR